MEQRRKRARVLGPYRHHAGWRIVVIAEDGGRTDQVRPTEEEAHALIAEVQAALELEGPLTVRQAIEKYEVARRTDGAKPATLATTMFRLRSMLKPALEQRLCRLTPERAGQLYGELAARQAADTHRNALAEVKTFARWCVEQRILRASPWERVKPTGDRKHGKEQLRVNEARRFLAVALARAAEDDGAVAALCGLLLGLRPGEVVARVGRDVDDEGRLLWVPATKTRAGRRALEVPECLQEHLVRLADTAGKLGLLWPHRRPWVLDQVERLCALAGVTVVTAQALRGTSASVAFRAGREAHAIAAQLGHASPSMTLAAYADPAAVADARQGRFLQVLDGGPGQNPGKKQRRARSGNSEPFFKYRELRREMWS